MGEVSNNRMKICVVGGGAAGLAVTKIFKDSQPYKSGLWEIDVFEEREDIGGTWLSSPAEDKDIPPPTPMYDSIITNLPHPIMCYLSYWFPPSTPLFPKAEVVQDYLRAYSKEFDLMRHIQLNTTVVEARWTGDKWTVKSRTRNSFGSGLGAEEEVEQEGTYDKLIIANGHYRVPFYPPTPGLSSWRAARKVTHSAWYRRPVSVGEKVLVVGGGYSGMDIAEEMSTVCETLIHAAPHSIAESHGNIIVHASRLVALSDLSEENGQRVAYFEDGSQESDVDHVFLATGYVLSFPFLRPPQLLVTPPSAPIHPKSSSDPLPDHLHTSGHHMFPLIRFLFPISKDYPPESLAFIGLPIKVAPLPLFEAQARAVVRVFSDPSVLDVPKEIDAIHERLASLRSNPDIGEDGDTAIAHSYHIFKGREQFMYRDSLHTLALPSFPDLERSDWKVPEWVKECYENMADMRREWKEIVERGKDEEWVRGVGEGKSGKDGKDEWVDVMERLLAIVKKKRTEGERKGIKTRIDPEQVV